MADWKQYFPKRMYSDHNTTKFGFKKRITRYRDEDNTRLIGEIENWALPEDYVEVFFQGEQNNKAVYGTDWGKKIETAIDVKLDNIFLGFIRNPKTYSRTENYWEVAYVGLARVIVCAPLVDFDTKNRLFVDD